MAHQMRRFLGVAAAVLVGVGAALAGQGRSESHTVVVNHTCGLTDRQFLESYGMQLAAVNMYGSDFIRGSASAKEVIGVARSAANEVRAQRPLDPSLRIVLKYAPAMFMQYADAVRARENGDSAAREMYLAYSIGSRVEDTLREAKPGLERAGCDLSGVLQ
jgi:hypothetical protein